MSIVHAGVGAGTGLLIGGPVGAAIGGLFGLLTGAMMTKAAPVVPTTSDQVTVRDADGGGVPAATQVPAAAGEKFLQNTADAQTAANIGNGPLGAVGTNRHLVVRERVAMKRRLGRGSM